jgi:hypothetical protein
MTTDATPPAWAETILRLVLSPSHFESVSGDLLEEYRDSIHPVRGQQRADRWYINEVFGFVVRSVWIWGVLFGAAEVGRTALDWFVPTHDFALRSGTSTYVGIGLLLTAGFWAAWRSGSITSGPVSATLAVMLGELISTAGAAVMLALFHDRQTMSAIEASGGLGEFFTLPILLVLPALVLGTLGGALGAAAHAKLRIDPV